MVATSRHRLPRRACVILYKFKWVNSMKSMVGPGEVPQVTWKRAGWGWVWIHLRAVTRHHVLWSGSCLWWGVHVLKIAWAVLQRKDEGWKVQEEKEWSVAVAGPRCGTWNSGSLGEVCGSKNGEELMEWREKREVESARISLMLLWLASFWLVLLLVWGTRFQDISSHLHPNQLSVGEAVPGLSLTLLKCDLQCRVPLQAQSPLVSWADSGLQGNPDTLGFPPM